jgi:hypothetical protein
MDLIKQNCQCYWKLHKIMKNICRFIRIITSGNIKQYKDRTINYRTLVIFYCLGFRFMVYEERRIFEGQYKD